MSNKCVKILGRSAAVRCCSQMHFLNGVFRFVLIHIRWRNYISNDLSEPIAIAHQPGKTYEATSKQSEVRKFSYIQD